MLNSCYLNTVCVSACVDHHSWSTAGEIQSKPTMKLRLRENFNDILELVFLIFHVLRFCALGFIFN